MELWSRWLLLSCLFRLEMARVDEGLDDDGAGGCCRGAGGVGGDVVDGVGGDARGVEDDVGDECAVEVGFDAEVIKLARKA